MLRYPVRNDNGIDIESIRCQFDAFDMRRYAQVNNKYVRSYDSSKLSSYLMYYDINNLSRIERAMCQPLSYSNFEDAANFDASAIALDSPIYSQSRF